jgi:hypothetical protein
VTVRSNPSNPSLLGATTTTTSTMTTPTAPNITAQSHIQSRTAQHPQSNVNITGGMNMNIMNNQQLQQQLKTFSGSTSSNVMTNNMMTALQQQLQPTNTNTNIMNASNYHPNHPNLNPNTSTSVNPHLYSHPHIQSHPTTISSTMLSNQQQQHQQHPGSSTTLLSQKPPQQMVPQPPHNQGFK